MHGRVSLQALVLVLAGIVGASANNGQEGTFEYAIDAPWRIEPVIDAQGKASYGAIPIVITITDENSIPYDEGMIANDIGNFCELRINSADGTRRAAVNFRGLAEVEKSGNSDDARRPEPYGKVTFNAPGAFDPGADRKGFAEKIKAWNKDLAAWVNEGSWTPANKPAVHRICRPATENCEALASPQGTSEWHAMAWYAPIAADQFNPGTDLYLELEVIFTRSKNIACDFGARANLISLKNYVSVHAGEAPLPRFKDSRWAYGDLHYHSQGTDNEGEQGYGYRNTIRAMGSMGLDFVLATEHASDSVQVMDIDLDADAESLASAALYRTPEPIVDSNGGVLRDMNAERFSFLHSELWRPGGANLGAALENPFGGSQNVLARNIAPQIYLGGEVDSMSELPAMNMNEFRAALKACEEQQGVWWNCHSYPYGNGLLFDLTNLCGGWITEVIEGYIFGTKVEYSLLGDCPLTETLATKDGATILKDMQGPNELWPSRNHFVYMPQDERRADAFLSSHTLKYGGGSRQITRGDDALFRELEGDLEHGGSAKGYTFLAHPVPSGSCEGKLPDLMGGVGPDIPPSTPTMLLQAFRSPAVLGLQFWNEDNRMVNKVSDGTVTITDTAGNYAVELGMHQKSDEGAIALGQKLRLRNSAPNGFAKGSFEMYPWAYPNNATYAFACSGTDWMLHHGLKTWDDLLMRGLSPAATSDIYWLPEGEPRRLFMAGGSDAHGDLNYNRAGYARGLTSIADMAIGKPRNLVFAGVAQRKVSGPQLDASSADAVVTPIAAVGAAAVPRDAAPPVGALTGVRAFSQTQVLAGLKRGSFTVTDGPALRLAIDKNNNGIIDDADAQMGDIVEMYGDKTLPLLIEWETTPEWGEIEQVEIVIGALNSVVQYEGKTFDALFAPIKNGPRTIGTARWDKCGHREVGLGRIINCREDGYYEDPTLENPDLPLSGSMRFSPISPLAGTHKMEISLSKFSVGEAAADQPVLPDRLYVRAYARAQKRDTQDLRKCKQDAMIAACIPRYAFTNPVWAISPPRPEGACPINKPRAIDSDGDGLPNGCDPCPYSNKTRCEAPSPGELGGLTAERDDPPSLPPYVVVDPDLEFHTQEDCASAGCTSEQVASHLLMMPH